MERHLIVALNEELQNKEELWRLKSRVTWLTTRDLNTRYFHTSTIIRRRRNAIDFLKIEEGTWISSREDIGNYMSNYFQNMFQSRNPEIPDDLEGLITPIITEE